jgi:hypothetical protein
MINNKPRNGNYTSSEIVALTTVAKDGKSFGKPALTYIEETNMERRLGRSLTDESNARALVWGKLLEGYWFDLLGLEYTLSSTETDVHPTIPYWAGSKDGMKKDTVIDIKSPITLKSFCQLVQPLYDGFTGIDAMNAVRENHKDGEKYYWQLVSNAIINNTRHAELVVGMPFFSEIPQIKKLADGLPNCYWIAMANDDELPFLLDGGYYKNINIIRFEVPQEDKDFLTERVKKAGEFLIERPSMMLAQYEENDHVTIVESVNIPLIKI